MTEDPFLDKLSAELRQLMGQKSAVELTEEVLREAFAKDLPDKGQLEQVKTELLAWVGFHRGKAISEEAMPRFHEIIDRLDAITK